MFRNGFADLEEMTRNFITTCPEIIRAPELLMIVGTGSLSEINYTVTRADWEQGNFPKNMETMYTMGLTLGGTSDVVLGVLVVTPAGLTQDNCVIVAATRPDLARGGFEAYAVQVSQDFQKEVDLDHEMCVGVIAAMRGYFVGALHDSFMSGPRKTLEEKYSPAHKQLYLDQVLV